MTPWLPSALVNHLWQSTLFVLLVWLVALALRENRSRVRYWLWAAASMKFFIPVSALVSLGERFQWRAAPASVPPALSFLVDDVFATAFVVTAAPASAPVSSSVVPWLLLAVWVAGAAGVLISWWRQWLPVQSALRCATFVQLDASYDVADLVVMSSPSMSEPGVVGILRPVLLLPEGIVQRLPTAQMRALIAHERCHIRAQDNLIAALHMAVEVLFWFHPVVWWIETGLVDERERSCDEAVLQAGNEPYDYAAGMLQVCRYAVERRISLVAGISGSNLRRRVESILRNDVGRPLTAARRLTLAVAVAMALGGPIAGGAITAQVSSQPQQERAAQPPSGEAVTFEVASVRPNKSGALAGGRRVTRGRIYTATNASMRNVIASAYGIPAARVLGGPTWLGVASVDVRFVGGERFDIMATLPEGTTVSQVPAMLRALLADRFKLVAHTEMREAPMYALVIARSDGRLGPQLRQASIDCEAAEAAGEVIPRPKPGERGLCDSEIGGEIVGRGQRLGTLARSLSLFAERQVVDRTGLTGGFDFDLRFPELNTPPGGRGDGPGSDGAGGMFIAVQEQLGLKLESIRGPLEVVVIDSVEHPTEN